MTEQTAPQQLFPAGRLEPKFQVQVDTRDILLGVIAVGLVATVYKVNKQRKIINKIVESEEAISQFIKVMVDETSCGEETYTYLQIMAEEEETVDPEGAGSVDWSAEDEASIPYIPEDVMSTKGD